MPTWPSSSTACEIAVPTSVKNSPTCPSTWPAFSSADSDGGGIRIAFVRRFPGRGAGSPCEASGPSFEAPQPMLVPPQTNRAVHPAQASKNKPRPVRRPQSPATRGTLARGVVCAWSCNSFWCRANSARKAVNPSEAKPRFRTCCKHVSGPFEKGIFNALTLKLPRNGEERTRSASTGTARQGLERRVRDWNGASTGTARRLERWSMAAILAAATASAASFTQAGIALPRAYGTGGGRRASAVQASDGLSTKPSVSMCKGV